MSHSKKALGWIGLAALSGAVLGVWVWHLSGRWATGVSVTLVSWAMFTWGDRFSKAEFRARVDQLSVTSSAPGCRRCKGTGLVQGAYPGQPVPCRACSTATE